jgi:hypothetical protein
MTDNQSLGIIPYDTNAEKRMRDLTEAIQRELSRDKVNLYNVKRFAKEITLQCDLEKELRGYTADIPIMPPLLEKRQSKNYSELVQSAMKGLG